MREVRDRPIPLEELDLTDPEFQEEKPLKFGFLDILAFTIAAYQIIFPMLLVFIGVILLVYLGLRLLGG